MKHYIGVKQIQAEPQEKDGRPGYKVVYQPDGYTSWSPKEIFEAAYFPLSAADGSKITQEDVNAFIGSATPSTLGAKTTILHATLLNDFEMVESSSCVDPGNYSESLGAEFCREKIEDSVWGLLGFVLQWAKSGLKAR